MSRKGTRAPTPKKALTRLKAAFRRELGLGRTSATNLLAGATLYDKAYELSALIALLTSLRLHKPGIVFRLVNGAKPTFRTKGGAINRGTWPYIEVRAGGAVLSEVWVDIELLSLSAWRQGKAIHGRPYGRAHELDIVVVLPGTAGFPEPRQVLLGVEAKHRLFNKALLKELLGVRREMCFAAAPASNDLAWWSPTGRLPANPPSGLALFCSGSNVGRYDDPAEFWGIKMIHHPY